MARQGALARAANAFALSSEADSSSPSLSLLVRARHMRDDALAQIERVDAKGAFVSQIKRRRNSSAGVPLRSASCAARERSLLHEQARQGPREGRSAAAVGMPR